MILCPVCKSNKRKNIDITFDLKFSTASKKKKDKLNFKLVECNRCQNYYNQSFDIKKLSYSGDTLNTFFANKYWKKYENTLRFTNLRQDDNLSGRTITSQAGPNLIYTLKINVPQPIIINQKLINKEIHWQHDDNLIICLLLVRVLLVAL